MAGVNKVIEINSEYESRIYTLGVMEGLNRARLRFCGFGYDNDETGREIRGFTSEQIHELKEMLDISFIGSQSFSTVCDYMSEVNSSQVG